MNQSPQKNLGKKAAHGAAWMAIGQVLARGIGIVRLIVLTWLISRAELGLFGIAFIVIQLIESLSNTGMQHALIQRTDDIGDFIDTAWTSQVVRGTILGVLVFLLANTAEHFFAKPGVAALLRTLSIYPIVRGAFNAGIVYLHRELRFRPVVTIRVVVAAADLIVSVLAALISPTAMALVFGKIAGAFAGLVASYIVEQRRAAFRFSWERFRMLYAFGFWIFASTIVGFILVRGGDMIIGKLLPNEELAMYQVAFGIACTPIVEMMRVVGSTTFSAYSRIQHDRERLQEAFLRVIALSSYTIAISIALLVVCGKSMTATFFAANYGPMSGLLVPLGIWGGCRALGAMNSVLFQAIGRPEMATVFQVVMMVMFGIVIVPAAKSYGILGVAYGLAGIGLVAQLLRYSLVVKLIGIAPSSIGARLLWPLALGSVAALTGHLITLAVRVDLPLVRMLIGFAVTCSVFLWGAILLDQTLQFGVVDFVAARWAARRSKSNFKEAQAD